MQVLLKRSDSLSYGQDRRADAAARKLPISVVGKLDTHYELPISPTHLSLVISFNCDDPADALLVASLPRDVPVVVHCQLRPSFVDDNEGALERAAATLRRATRVAVPATFMKELLVRTFAIEAPVVIANGADSSIFRPRAADHRRAYREQLGISPSARIIAWVSQSTPAKGKQLLPAIARALSSDQILLLRSFSRRKEARDRLIVPELDSTYSANPACVKIQAEDGDRTANPIPYADVLLVTSLCEVAPLVVTEALLSGVPVVATHCTPFYDELASEGFGPTDIRLVELPAGTSERSRTKLALDDDSVEAIASTVAHAAQHVDVPNDDERIDRARRAWAAGMVEEVMLSSFQRLWNQAARAVQANER